MAILYDWYENPGESDDSEEKGLIVNIFHVKTLSLLSNHYRGSFKSHSLSN